MQNQKLKYLDGGSAKLTVHRVFSAHIDTRICNEQGTVSV
jgi:hypothetical protein